MGFSIHHHLDYKFCIIFAYFIRKKYKIYYIQIALFFCHFWFNFLYV